MKLGKVFKVISDIIFITGLAIAGIFLYFHLSGKPPFHVYIVSSGSMAPRIPTGSLVAVSSKEEYSFGDIVSFYSSASKKETTTHRIVGIHDTLLRTAGDANNQPDPILTDVSRVIGAVSFSIPYLGYIASYAKTPPGFILLVIVPATIIIYEELKSLLLELRKVIQNFASKRKSLPDPTDPERAIPPKSLALFNPKPAIVIPVFFAAIITLGVTVSFFVDYETSSGNVFAASATETPTPTPTPPTTPTDPFADSVEAVTGTFGHCCDSSNLSSDPLIAAGLVTAAPDSPPDFDFIQISDNSSVTARFVDNKAVDGPGTDVRLHVYDAEFPGSALVELSSDCSSFISFGIHSDIADVDLDLTGSGLTDAVCVRITDQFAEGDTFPTLGFDLDAIEALNSVSVP